MANTLTGLIPTLYKAADVVSREMVGFIPSVFLDASAEQAAKDQTISYPITAAMTAGNITPASTGPSPSGETISPGTMSISKARSISFPWNGEEILSLGSTHEMILRDQFAQAMRTLVNEVEADLAALYIYASRAYGTAGTTPFGSNLGEAAQILKILKDNGAPESDLNLVINTTAGANLRTLTQLNKANEAGTVSLRERGILLPTFGMAIRESAQTKNHTKGTGSGYLVDLTAGYAVGSTTVHVDTGTGTILAGDVLTNAATGVDTNKYIVKTGFAGDGDGDVVLANPGLKIAWVNNNAVAVGASYAANMAFARNAIHLLTRVPAMPPGGDAADDVMVITDPVSGISFQVAMYRQYRQVSYEVGLAWGVKAVKAEHIAILLG